MASFQGSMHDFLGAPEPEHGEPQAFFGPTTDDSDWFSYLSAGNTSSHSGVTYNTSLSLQPQYPAYYQRPEHLACLRPALPDDFSPLPISFPDNSNCTTYHGLQMHWPSSDYLSSSDTSFKSTDAFALDLMNASSSRAVDAEHAFNKYHSLSALMESSSSRTSSPHDMPSTPSVFAPNPMPAMEATVDAASIVVASLAQSVAPRADGPSHRMSPTGNGGEEDAFLVANHAQIVGTGEQILSTGPGTRSQAAMTKQLYKSLRLRLFPRVTGPISRVTQLQSAINRIDALESEVAQLRAVCEGRELKPTAGTIGSAAPVASKARPWIQYTPTELNS